MVFYLYSTPWAGPTRLLGQSVFRKVKLDIATPLFRRTMIQTFQQSRYILHKDGAVFLAPVGFHVPQMHPPSCITK
jgi:hypothetical protein